MRELNLPKGTVEIDLLSANLCFGYLQGRALPIIGVPYKIQKIQRKYKIAVEQYKIALKNYVKGLSVETHPIFEELGITRFKAYMPWVES